MARKKPAVSEADAPEGERSDQGKDNLAKVLHLPMFRNATIAAGFAKSIVGEECDFVRSVGVVAEECRKTRKGDMSPVTHMLTAQAMTLDAVFTDLLARSGRNLGEYPDAAERYLRMALKAQSQCRTTLEALAKVARGGEQVVRHIHVNNGGQAVIAENLHTGGQNAIGAGQPYEPSPALLGEDACGNGVPLPCDPRPEALPSSWRS